MQNVLIQVARHPALLLVLAAVTAAGLIYIRQTAEMGQHAVIRSAYLLGAAGGAGWLWLVLVSRLRWRWRVTVALLPLFTAPVLALGFHIEGVDGNLLPMLRWRYGHREPALPQPRPSRATPTAFDEAGHDYPQFLGPHRNGHVPAGVGLARRWSAPLQLVWQRDVGEAWSAFAIAGRLAVTQEQYGEAETVVCYDLANGTPVWTHRDHAAFNSTIAGNGPRATPTIHGDRVVTIGATGLLNCLDLATGAPHWSVDVLADNDGSNQEWGISGSPLVVDDLVVVNPPGTHEHALAAYGIHDGRKRWTAGGDTASYSSPTLADLGGRRQVVIVHGASVAGHDPSDGRPLWRVPWPGKYPKVAQPVVLPGDRLFVAASYGVGCALIQIDTDDTGALRAAMVWSNRYLKAKFTNVVFHEGFLYGLDEGILVCLDPADGRRVWKAGRYGHGQLICVEGLLIVQCESGEVALVEASPQGHAEVGRFAALDDRTWNNPVLAGRFLVVRNHREAACYTVPIASPTSPVKVSVP